MSGVSLPGGETASVTGGGASASDSIVGTMNNAVNVLSSELVNEVDHESTKGAENNVGTGPINIEVKKSSGVSECLNDLKTNVCLENDRDNDDDVQHVCAVMRVSKQKKIKNGEIQRLIYPYGLKQAGVWIPESVIRLGGYEREEEINIGTN